MGRICTLEEMIPIRAGMRAAGHCLVFTNGVFDILHRGHCEYLAAARAQGDALVVGLNSDASVRRLKGEKKPIVMEEDRAAVLAALASVDYVILFGDDTPQALISALLPDVLIKGGDYTRETIVGCAEVEAAGGRVFTIPLTAGRSSTNIVTTIIERYCTHDT
ncbi:MAG: D-glycero-beta-D-manno-heptose 1-phosphate adenylyltransferase [Bacteroidota bacterium]|jgi:rfaE bifunctional protein nucleotidyltransferase chain/domain|nr:D-glycero-beta-D-manno-heptose 1-phosphate adenylyltransferase [Bacteroidota bacterium]